jgi:hypothetical protein
MTTKPNNQNQPDQDNNPNANDNHKPARGEVAAAATGSTALTSLEALGTVLNAVDTTSVVGGSGLSMLQFKRDGGGVWAFGQKRTIVEEGSSWAVNPTSFRWGFICFNNDNKPTERLVPVSQPKPDVTELPDTGFKWHEQWAVNVKCIDGTDAGTEVVYKPTTVGGIEAVKELINTIRGRLNAGQHGGKVSPIVHLEKDFYQDKEWGRVWIPVLDIVDWMPLAGPPPAAPTPASLSTAEPTPQPRRRRVG